MDSNQTFISRIITHSNWTFGTLFFIGIFSFLGGFSNVFKIYLLDKADSLHPLQLYLPFVVGLVCFLIVSFFQEERMLKTLVNLLGAALYIGCPLLGILALASFVQQSRIELKVFVLIVLILLFIVSRIHLKNQGMLVSESDNPPLNK